MSCTRSPFRRGAVRGGALLALVALGVVAIVVVIWLGPRIVSDPGEGTAPPTLQGRGSTTPDAAGDPNAAVEQPDDAMTFTSPDTAASRPPLRLTGRAVQDGGAPLGNAHLRARVEGDRRSSPLGELVQTDERGRFVWNLSSAPSANTAASFSTIVNGFESLASIRIPEGSADLGDVVFSSPPVIVAGRVVDASGEALSDVRLSIARIDTSSEEALDGPPPSASRSKSAVSDGDGRFEIRGPAPEGRLVLTAQAAERTTLEHEFRAGDANVLLVMPRQPGYRGQILFDVATLYTRLRLFARGPGPKDEVSIPLEDRGRFSFEVSWHGASSFELRGLSWVGEPLVLFDDLFLTPEGEHEERFDLIDLRGKLNITRLRVENPSGEMLRHIRLEILPDRTIVSNSTVHAGGEHLLVYSGVPPLVRVSSGYLRSVDTVLEPGNMKLTLARGYSVTLNFDGIGQIPAGVAVQAWFRPSDSATNAAFSNVVAGVVQLELPSAGSWRGGLVLQQDLPSDDKAEFDGARVQVDGQEFTFDVVATNSPQAFTIPIDALTLERAATVVDK